MTASEYFTAQNIAVPTMPQIDEFVRFSMVQQTLTYNAEAMRREDYDNAGTMLTFAIIQDKVAERFQVNVSDLQLPTRKRNIVEPRQVVMTFANKVLRIGLDKVGKMVGNKDHSTVIHACRTVSTLYSSDRAYRNRINMIAEECGIGEDRIRMVLAERSERWHP